MTLSDKNRKRLQTAVRKFHTANILVIGDIIVDHFIWGSVSRISPEAPVPVVNVTHENLMLGGSANVLHNIYAQGAKSALCGVIGTDAMGDHLLKLLADLGSPTSGIVRSDNRPTILKTRIVAQHQQVVRFDREKTGELSKARLAEVKRFLDNHLADFDAVIVSDYDKGMISQTLMTHLRKLLAKSKIPLIVDPKPRHAERFKGVTIITPNHHEAELMSGMKIGNEKELTAAARKMQKTLNCQAVLITRGEAGMALFEKGQPLYTIPTVAKEVYDVTGAGDTVAATLALGLAVGLGFAEAATLANFAAGIVVGKVGTATASTEELLRAIA
ncbi:MAG: D-glycero-beta-D-manno-heptose-7-phosphate kinase [Thermodesulfobacteriota bacterium]